MKHRQQLHDGYTDTDGDGIPNYDEQYDYDGDRLSNSYEDAHGFDKWDVDTDGDGELDAEEEAELAELAWHRDSHNAEDYANPGKQYPPNVTWY